MESSRVIQIKDALQERIRRDSQGKSASRVHWETSGWSACLSAWAAIARRALRLADAWTVRKTASYYALHICVATLLAYLVTGNWRSAITLSLLEPTVQAFAYYFHERTWQRLAKRPSAQAREGTNRFQHG